MANVNTLIGQAPHRYQILKALGQGNYATVFKAKHLETNRIVAIKKIKKLNKQVSALVKKQIQIMKNLKHKNIVEYFTDFRHNGEWYIVLEYCGKGDLQNYKKTVGKIPEYHCKLFVKCILEGLIYLHSKNIAHRDLKLANILITDDYQLKLADFGLSKDDKNLLTSFCGTPLCMAPEILRRQQSYSLKCDVWSLGVLTYLMLYNSYPYIPSREDGLSVESVAKTVNSNKLKFNSNVKISESGIDFVLNCLQKDSQKRPSTSQLKMHPWLKEGLQIGNTSSLRIKAISSSLSENGKVQQKFCNLMLYGVFESQIHKIASIEMISQQKILKTIKDLQSYYGSNIFIRQLVLLMCIKKLRQFQTNSVTLVIEDSSIYSIPLAKLNKFTTYVTEISNLIKQQFGQNQFKESINIQRQLIKFTYKQILNLLGSTEDINIQSKVNLMKAICRLITIHCPSTTIKVKWGNNPEQDDIAAKVAAYLSCVNTEDVINGINEQLVDDDDLQSAWLIEHQIPKQMREPIENIQLVTNANQILNISSNFSSQRRVNSQFFEIENDD